MAKVGKDARGRKVSVGDHVLNKTGQVLVIARTEKSFRILKLARAKTIHSDRLTYVKLGKVFRIRRTVEKSTRGRWRKLYDKYAKPTKRKAAQARRKAEASTTMWPCPVCMNGKEPIRFKIGIQVWDGKRLRVCATRCKRRVLREVKETGNRTRVARKYMKRGKQV